eukprot:244255_1
MGLICGSNLNTYTDISNSIIYKKKKSLDAKFNSKVRKQLISILLYWTRTTKTLYNFPFDIVETLIVDKYLYHAQLDISNVLYWSAGNDFSFKFAMIGNNKSRQQQILNQWGAFTHDFKQFHKWTDCIEYFVRYKQYNIDIKLLNQPPHFSYLNGIDGLFFFYNCSNSKDIIIGDIKDWIQKIIACNGVFYVPIGLIGDFDKKNKKQVTLKTIDIPEYDIAFIHNTDRCDAYSLMEMVENVLFLKQKPFFR